MAHTNLVFSGYKLRTHIARALQRCSDAIRTALVHYNQLAMKLKPPHPALSWMQVVDYGFLGEFDLLCHSRLDVRTQDWAKPGHCELTTIYMELCQSREEMDRLNVEIKHLRMAMHDEAFEYTNAIKATLEIDSVLTCELQHHWCLRNAIHTLHECRLLRVMSMSGFTGNKELGVWLGTGTPAGHLNTQEQAPDLPTGSAHVSNKVLLSEDFDGGTDGLQDLSVALDAFLTFVDGIDM